MKKIVFLSLIVIILSCKKENPPVPILNTSEIKNVTATTASSGGNIIDEGGSTVINRGVCWSTDPNPTINSNKTLDGSGSGSFISKIENLKGGAYSC